MKNLSILLFVGLFSFTVAFSQSLAPSVVSLGGGYGQSNGYTLSYTLGEMMIETYRADAYILTQGFQQPSLKEVEENAEKPVWITSVYPNPAWNLLNVSIEPPEGSSFEIELINAMGVLMEIQYELRTSGGIIKYQLNLDGLAAGVYFVRLIPMDDPSSVQSFQINKLN